MSAALLKKSLQIVEESLNDQKKKVNVDTKSNKHGKNLKRLNDFEKDDNAIGKELKLKSKPEKRKSKLDKSTAELLFAYARGETKDNLIEETKKKKKQQEESIFTEEDFKKFEQEYFG